MCPRAVDRRRGTRRAARRYGRRRSVPPDNGKSAALRVSPSRNSRSRAPRRRAKSDLLELEHIAMAAAETAYDPLRRGRGSVAPSQPRPVNAVARAVDVASPDALETQEQIAVFARPRLFQLIGKAPRSLAAQPRDRAPRPFAGRPGRVGKEPRRLAGALQSGGQPFQISLRAAGLGMPAPDQADR